MKNYSVFNCHFLAIEISKVSFAPKYRKHLELRVNAYE